MLVFFVDRRKAAGGGGSSGGVVEIPSELSQVASGCVFLEVVGRGRVDDLNPQPLL